MTLEEFEKLYRKNNLITEEYLKDLHKMIDKYEYENKLSLIKLKIRLGI